MGTRGFLGFVVDGTEKIAYNHWDSYPDGLGLTVLAWLRETDLEALPERVRALEVVSDEVPPDDLQVAKLQRAGFVNTDVGGRSERVTWYQALRETQGNPEATLAAGFVEDAHLFPLDSLFCEWGYLVDLDAGVLEVYKGFTRGEATEGRWAGQREEGSDYAAVTRVKSWPLTELPTEDEFVRVDEEVDA